MNVVKVCFILPLLESRDSPLYKDSCSIVQAVDSWMAMRDGAESTQTDFKFVLCISRFDISQSRNDFVDAIKSLINEGVSAFAVLGDPAMAELAAYLNGTNSTIPIFVIACRHSYVYEHVFYVWRDADTIACRIAQSLVAEKCKRIALLTDSGAYGLDYLESFERLSVTYGLNVDSSFFNAHSRDKYRFPFSESDEAFSRFETTLSDLLSKEKWDAIVILGYGTGFNRCFNTILAKLPDAKIYTDHFFTYPQGCNGNNVFAPCIRLDDERICSYRAEWHKTRMTFRCVGHAKESESCLPDPKSDVLVSRSVSGNDSVNAAGACEARALKTLIGSTLDILAEAVKRCRGGGDLSSALFGIKHLETFVGPVLLQNCEGACFQIAIKNKSEQDKLQLEIYDNSSIAYLLQTIDDSAKTIDINVVRKGVEKGRIVGRLREIYDSIFQPAMTKFNLDFVSAFDSIGSSEFGCVYTLNQVADSMLGDMEHVLSLHVLDALDGPLQINAHDDDVEQNDAIRIFVVGQSGKCTHKILSLVYYKALMAEEKAPEIVGLVLARSSRAAKCLWSRHGCECLGGVKEETPVITELHSDDGRLTSVSERLPLVDVADFVRTCVTWARYLYVVPTGSGTTASFGTKVRSGYVVVSAQKLRAGKRLGYFPLIMLDTIISRAFSSLYSGLAILRIEAASTRSAIGSIMSRNGSHNIGSHVLAALSHNVGTMPDDRVLYQYIQHRMDYIATVTTDFPSWTQPTMFIGEMMKTFLSQRHLLEHIVGSEGLHAWQYQNPSWRDRDPEGCIQFHIRKLKEGKWVDFIDYAEYCKGGAEAPYKKSEKDTQTQYLTLSDDVALAIPGGVVGQHAFFTILENIIRNVAKHDWCTAKRDLKNMEIFIDFEDQEEDVRFCIWSKCSSANDNLVRSLEEKINASFIDKTGALRRENWGLAEMKISAGYLQRKDIGEIGGLDNSSSKGAEIIRPILVSENGKDNSLSYLGYEFRVAKPKTIAFVVSEAKELQHLFAEFQKNQDRVKKFRELGISILSENDLVAKAHKLDYEFVVLESLGEDQLGWDVPFRVLTATKTKLSAAGKIIACLGMDKYKSLLQGLFESGESVEDVANACKECKKEVLGSWCRHLIEDKRRIEKIGIDLIVQTSGTDRSNGAQRTLVQEVDVLKVVFSECFNTAVEQYKALNRLPDQVLHLLDYWKERNIKCQEDLAKLKDQCSTVRGWIAWWLEYLLHGAEADEGIQTKIDKAYLKHVQDGLRQFSPSPLTAKGCCNALEAFQSGGKRDVRAEIDRAKAPLDKELAGFIAFLGSFQAQADVFLRKYGERIVSLPREFVVDKQRSQKGFDWKAAGINVCFENASSGGSERKSIDYRRHFNANNDRDEQSLFVESLSGTQSYLTHLANLKDDDYVTITKLTESALTRVLIVDERVANFVRLHPLMARVYKHMEIYVADDVRLTDELRGKKFNGEDANDGESANGLTCIPIDFLKEARDRIGGYDGKKGLSEDDCKEICKEGKFSPDLIFKKLFPRSHRNMRKKVEEFGLDYDVLIVHQGLLDKLLPESIAHDDLRLAVFLELLKTVIPCVAITTGRGTPANIPSGAHLLPFSTIESTLFKQYPEKMTLIDTVMNILPVRRKSQEES